MPAATIAAELGRAGFVHLRGPLDHAAYLQLAGQLGDVVAEEKIALRPGAHAYVAKPGRVPLHTDHPDVRVIGWRCEEQDGADGASLLLDAQPVVKGLPEEVHRLLHEVELWCPPLAGGPPVLRRPVLSAAGDRDLVFCSPWLRSASQAPDHEAALALFRERLSTAAKQVAIEIRLSVGDALFVDNRRVLHGRRAIAETSARRLYRVWVR